MRKNGIVSFSARDNSAIFGPIRSRRFIPPKQPSPALPYLDGSVLGPFPQHDARLINHLAERVGFDDFGSLDVTAFVQEKSIGKCAWKPIPCLGGASVCRLRLRRHVSQCSYHAPAEFSRERNRRRFNGEIYPEQNARRGKRITECRWL